MQGARLLAVKFFAFAPVFLLGSVIFSSMAARAGASCQSIDTSTAVGQALAVRCNQLDAEFASVRSEIASLRQTCEADRRGFERQLQTAMEACPTEPRRAVSAPPDPQVICRPQLDQIASLRQSCAEERRTAEAASARELEQARADLAARTGELEQLRREVAELREQADRSATAASSQARPPAAIRECNGCPELRPVAVGVPVVFGNGQDRQLSLSSDTAAPAQPFDVALHEVSVGEFRAFLTATGRLRDFRRSCRVRWGMSGGKDVMVEQPSVFAALSVEPPADAERHPAVCISLADAKAYAVWLTETAGGSFVYELPNEIEWEYAARAGIGAGSVPPTQDYTVCSIMNVADATLQDFYNRGGSTLLTGLGARPSGSQIARCSDTAALTEPVDKRAGQGRFELSNLLGNVAEWTASCWSQGTGSGADCSKMVIRGGSFASGASDITVWYRDRADVADQSGTPLGYFDVGFRVVRRAR